MNGHTPGTWKYCRNGNGNVSLVDERGVIIAEFFTNGINNAEANARLAAYAPEMYEAIGLLKGAMDVTATFLREKGYDTTSARELTDGVDELIRWIDETEY